MRVVLVPENAAEEAWLASSGPSPHCWHPIGFEHAYPKAHQEHVCCHCGKRMVLELPTARCGREHGQFLPAPHGTAEPQPRDGEETLALLAAEAATRLETIGRTSCMSWREEADR